MSYFKKIAVGFMAYLKKAAIGFDQFANTLFNGETNETISSACYRYKDMNMFRWLLYKGINCIFFWQDDHCYESLIAEIKRNRAYAKNFRHYIKKNGYEKIAAAERIEIE